MTVKEIKKAVDDGKTVYCGNESYEVIKDSNGHYYIYRKINDYAIGLTWRDGITLNSKEDEFFIKEGNNGNKNKV